MFRRRDEEGWDSFENRTWDDELSDGSPVRRLLPLLLGLIILAAIIAGAYFLVQRTAFFDSPQRAGAQWLEVFIEGDTQRLLDLTCADQIEVANARAGVKATQALIEIVPIIEMLDLASVLPGINLDINRWIEDVDFDLSNLNYNAPENPVGQAMLIINGQLRVRPIGDVWFGVPIAERWRMVEESNTWKWCGREPQTP